ncbi:protein kinase [Streptomyces sp. NPDC046261]|uniref:serine/threonine-protein kinase n=1 Tax=Streptomyces sp. NPDC046261 TaxID=3157200 RepID=UPI0034062DA3
MAGRFALSRRLGGGGMGTVWRARDMELQRDVALKEVRTFGPDSPEDAARVRERVLREARALARIQHPHVVTIHQVVDDTPFPWLVMELVDGVSLEERMASGPLPPAFVAGVGRDVLSALNAAHEAGIQHRDVKPANVIIRPDGSAVLTDFGIAALDGPSGLTMPGGVIGSPEFMAPERAAGEAGGPAADLWSLGMSLYVAVEGTSPLRRETPLSTLTAVRESPVPAPTRAGPLEPVLRALLARDPAARPTAAHVAVMLTAAARSAAATTVSTPTPHPPTAPAWPEPRHPRQGGSPTTTGHATRRNVAVAVIAVCLVAVGATAAILGLRDGGEDGPRSVAPHPSATSATAPPSATPATPRPAVSSAPAPPPQATRAPETAQPSDTARVAGDESANTWIAQLASVKVSEGTASRDRELAAVRRRIPTARTLLSDDFAALRPGYWVVYAPGPFPDGRSALSFCSSVGRTTDEQCVGRYLSHRPSDGDLICAHSPDGAASGRCRRD